MVSEAQKKHNREYYLKNKDKILESNRRSFEKNKADRIAYKKQWYIENRDRCRELNAKWHAENKRTYKPRKKKLDSCGICNKRMSGGIRYSLRAGKQGRSWVSLVPYTLDDLIKHLKSTLPDGYTWDDLDKLHIDHKIPIAVFNYEKPEDDDFQRCWALSNLQLLPALENMRKNDNIDKPFQPSLVFK